MLIILLLQETVSRWYETPTVVAAAVALIGVISAPFINSWLQNRKTGKSLSGHLSDTSLNLNAQERKEIMEQMKANHQQEVQFMQKQLRNLVERYDRQGIDLKVAEYEARQKAHAYGNECNRLSGQVYKLQLELTKADLPVPDFTFKNYPEIMAGVDEKVIEYKEELLSMKEKRDVD